MDMRFAWKILIWCVFVLIILYLLVSYSIPKKQKLSYGVTFSQKFSAELVGDKWKQNYLAVLDDLKIKDLRLVAYWNKIGSAEKIYPAVFAWQVENEPLFPFGECGTTTISLLNQEIKLVKSLSDKPVILTDSGELGFAWPYLATKSDIFGTTLYRYVTHKWLGDIRYSLIPAYYFRIKARWAGKILGKQIIISELQAEPWSQVSLAETSFDDQAKSMSPEKFREIIDYAERSGFPKAYLWGAEWWYWMKEKQGRPEMWEAARSAINNPPAGRAGF